MFVLLQLSIHLHVELLLAPLLELFEELGHVALNFNFIPALWLQPTQQGEYVETGWTEKLVVALNQSGQHLDHLKFRRTHSRHVVPLELELLRAVCERQRQDLVDVLHSRVYLALVGVVLKFEGAVKLLLE